MWQAGYLIIVFATLDSSCLKTISKAGFTSKKSNFGRLDIGSSTKQILNKNNESNATKPQDGLKPFEGYQSDQPTSTAWGELVASKLRQLHPTVYCGGDSMTLRVQGNNMPNFMVDGDDGLVSLTQMNENCGLSMTKGSPYAAFTIRYDGCYVTQKGDDYVLPLHLWGIPINMSCTVAVSTPNISCLSSGMVTRLGCSSANGLKLKVNGKWHPFIPASRLCGITTASETDGMVITAPYQSNCWQIKGDEMFLSILYGNNEFILSCPDSDDSYPYGHVEIISDQSPVPDLPTPSDLSTTIGLVSESDQPQAVPISPTTTAPTPISTSNPVDIRYFPYMYYPFDPMLHHKPKPYGYPWAFPPKVPTTAPTATTSQSTATTSSTVASNPEQPRYPLPPMYYPYGPMLYHHKPRPYGYPWAFPPKVPTTASTATTSQSTATTSSTVASNPEQPRYPLPPMYYPYGPMLYHHKPRPYGYPWAFPTKLPTTAPTETTSQSTATSSTVASNPEQPRYPLPPMYYPYGPMLYHHKPRPYGYPWAFPTKVPTTPTKLALPNITTMSPTAATKLDSIANDPYQPRYPLHHMYSPFGPMHCHFGHSHHLGYPLAFPAKVFTTAPNKLTSTTETPTVTSMTTPPIIASNSQQPPYLFNPYNFGQILHHPRPMPFDYLWAFPPKAPVTAQKISAPTTKTATTSPINCHGH